MTISKRNKIHNAEFSGKIKGMINGQSRELFRISDMVYSVCHITAVRS